MIDYTPLELIRAIVAGWALLAAVRGWRNARSDRAGARTTVPLTASAASTRARRSSRMQWAERRCVALAFMAVLLLLVAFWALQDSPYLGVASNVGQILVAGSVARMAEMETYARDAQVDLAESVHVTEDVTP